MNGGVGAREASTDKVFSGPPVNPVAQAAPAHGPGLSLAGQPVRRMRRTPGGLREKLSALLASSDAQKGRGFAIAGKSRSAHAPSPCFSRSRKHLVERGFACAGAARS